MGYIYYYLLEIKTNKYYKLIKKFTNTLLTINSC